METFPHKMPNIFINLDLHQGVPVSWALHIGGGQLSWCRFGDCKNNNGTVLADNEEVVSYDHSVKRLIVPHYNIIPPWPPNALIPILIAFSESQCKFAAHTVIGPDDAIAVSIFKRIGLNKACVDPCCLPTSFVFNISTVVIGFTLADFLKGLVSIFIDMCIDLLFFFLFKGLGKIKICQKIFRKPFKSVMLAFLRKCPIFNKIPRSFVKKGIKGFISTAEEMSESLCQSLIKDFFSWIILDEGIRDDMDKLAFNIIDNKLASIDQGTKKWLEEKSETFITKGTELAEKGTDWFMRDDIARLEINNLSHEAISQLSNDKKIEYLNDLRGGYMSEEDWSAQRKIYRNIPMTKEFKKYDDQKRIELIKKLKNDKVIQNAQKNWSKLPDNDKLDAMKRVSELQVKEYGFSKIPELKLYSKPQNNGMISNGYYSNSVVYLNKNPNSKFGSSFEKAVNVLTHENSHHYQHELVEQLKKGKISESDPRYEQAKLFHINSEPYKHSYVKPKKEHMNSYKSQPLEKHSFKTGNKIEKAM